ncbi:MAG: hypothetical protein ABSE51_03560 [Terracidiphilus sp.]|jgi:hypothetical protein
MSLYAQPVAEFVDGNADADEGLAEEGIEGAAFVEAYVGSMHERPVAKAPWIASLISGV